MMIYHNCSYVFPGIVRYACFMFRLELWILGKRPNLNPVGKRLNAYEHNKELEVIKVPAQYQLHALLRRNLSSAGPFSQWKHLWHAGIVVRSIITFHTFLV